MNLSAFFDAVRPFMKDSRLSAAQVKAMEAIILTGVDNNLTSSHIAYVLATAYHETGGLMEPVREGFCKTDAGSRKAVARLYTKGIIREDYALPQSNGKSYYGRGLVQLTHLYNYAKTGHALGLDLVTYPDLMLDLDVSVRAMVWGMVTGSYRKKKLIDILPENPSFTQWKNARGIINGDVGKNGPMIAGYAVNFYNALTK
jgi:predicted chitinase